MIQRLVLYLLAYGPLVLTLGGWIKLYRTRQQGWPRPIALIALGATTAIAAYKAAVILHYTL